MGRWECGGVGGLDETRRWSLNVQSQCNPHTSAFQPVVYTQQAELVEEGEEERREARGLAGAGPT